jgi:MFS family permease
MMGARTIPAKGQLFHGWVVAWVMFLSIGLVFGSRFSLGLFLPFLPDALDASPSAVSGAIALSMLGAGVLQPVVGLLSDRFGPRTLLLGGLTCGGGLFIGTALASELWQVAVLMTFVGGTAFAAVSPVLATAFMARWFDRHRGRALGLATSGTKVAMLTLVPAMSVGIAVIGWRPTLFATGLLIWTVVPLAFVFVRSGPEEMGLHPDGAQKFEGAARSCASESGLPHTTTLAVALRNPPFWLLAVGLFGNGFVMNLVFLHLPSFILELGYGQMIAAGGLSAMGAVGLVGHLLIGTLSDRVSRKAVLLILFAARIGAILFVVAVPGVVSLVTFVVVFGLLGYGALAVVGALAADLFGPKSLGAILGSAYVLNQIGGAAGVYSGGLSVDLTGSYQAALLLAAGASTISLVFLSRLPTASANEARD